MNTKFALEPCNILNLREYPCIHTYDVNSRAKNIHVSSKLLTQYDLFPTKHMLVKSIFVHQPPKTHINWGLHSFNTPTTIFFKGVGGHI